MDVIESRAYQVPKDHREHLLKFHDWIFQQSDLMQGDDVTRYLFEIYNEYIYRSGKEVETCSLCRMKVLSRMKSVIRTYKEKGIDRP
jgi:hypothetical protein